MLDIICMFGVFKFDVWQNNKWNLSTLNLSESKSKIDTKYILTKMVYVKWNNPMIIKSAPPEGQGGDCQKW